jgi:hypothetical protein
MIDAADASERRRDNAQISDLRDQNQQLDRQLLAAAWRRQSPRRPTATTA